MIHAYLSTCASNAVSPSTRSRAPDLAALVARRRGRRTPRGSTATRRGVVRRQMTGPRPDPVRSVAAVRGFYRFLVLDRCPEHSPADDLQPPRAWPALPRFLSLEEVDRLIAQPDVSTPRGLRDRAMIELLYATGMRVSELVGIRASDLHLDEHYVSCIGKGNKERLIPIGEQATDWVRRYQQAGRPALVKRASTRLFLNARGGPLSRVGFWKILKAHARRGNLPSTLSPHTIRHSFYRIRRARRDLRAIQMMLGHVDLSTTRKSTPSPRGAPFDHLRSLHPRP